MKHATKESWLALGFGFRIRCCSNAGKKILLILRRLKKGSKLSGFEQVLSATVMASLILLMRNTGKSSLVGYLYSFTRASGEWELFACASDIDIVATNSLKEKGLLPCVILRS